MDVTIGQLLDKKYRIVRLLGEGGMGAVYEGENVRIHHRVAIKVLHEGIATNSDFVQRFEREAQAAGQIGSEHIVEVYDLGELPGGARYMVMEYLDGENLSKRLARSERMLPKDLAPIMLQLLEGLGAAHDAQIVHRDLKPDNIFLQRNKNGQDFVKIVDFGVSKFNVLGNDSQMSMTRTGAVIGTPYYMSPEQAKGVKNSDHRSDLYAAGVVLFECTTGRVPFEGDTFNELMFKIVLEPPLDPEKLVPGLDPRFATIIRTAMAREPGQRYQSAPDFAQAILQWMRVAGLQSTVPNVFLRVTPTSAPLSGEKMSSAPALSVERTRISAASPAAKSVIGPVAPKPAGVTSVPSTMGTPSSTSQGSLNVVAVRSRTPPKRSSAGLIAIVAAGALMVGTAGLLIGIKLMKAKPAAVAETPATNAPVAAAAGPTSAAAPTSPTILPPDAAIAPPAQSPGPSAPSSATVPSPTPTAVGAAATGPTATPPVGHSASHHTGGNKTPAETGPATSTVQVKGRTVHTDL
jgi:serine/threonine protein kinase